MVRGGSKRKGSAFERTLAAKLSLWITHGKRDDCLWRSAISGGRATVRYKKGGGPQSACGDLCAVRPEGHEFCDTWLVEAKFYRDLRISSFLLDNKGVLATFWEEAVADAKKHKRKPMLIAKQNGTPELVIVETGALSEYGQPRVTRVITTPFWQDVYYLKDLLEQKYVPRLPTGGGSSEQAPLTFYTYGQDPVRIGRSNAKPK